MRERLNTPTARSWVALLLFFGSTLGGMAVLRGRPWQIALLSWMPDRNIKQHTSNLGHSQRHDIQPCLLLLGAELRDVDVPPNNGAGLIPAIAP